MNIAIVGAGAAGLFLAQQLSKNIAADIYVFEKTAKVATKLKASGGGRANILNENIVPDCYNQPAFIRTLLQKVDAKTIEQAFVQVGLKTVVDEENRVYPATLFAQTVVDVLLENMSPSVHIVVNTDIQKIQAKGNLWQLNNMETLFHKVIFASGSPAGMIRKNRQAYNAYLDSLQLDSKILQPSLSGFRIRQYPNILFGCRTRAIVSLYQNQQLIAKEKGEITFKEDGLSGIVVLNMSAYYNRLQDRQNCYLLLNFMYEDEDYDVERHLKTYKTLSGILHPKLNQLYRQKPFDVKNFRLDIEGVYDFEFAQVASGGIAVGEVDENFQLKRYKNLYAIGEMLDVDGICGGYNLFFAFASAYCVAKNIIDGNKNCQL